MILWYSMIYSTAGIGNVCEDISIKATWWLKCCQLPVQAIQIVDCDEYLVVVAGEFKSGPKDVCKSSGETKQLATLMSYVISV